MNMMEAKESRARQWLSYRSEIKVLDCTVRDGGLMNDHLFDDDIVRAVYQAWTLRTVSRQDLEGDRVCERKAQKVSPWGKKRRRL